MAKEKCPACIQKVPEYMLTYGDMVTLLLCFFVMLYTTGKTNFKEMQIILSVFKSATGFFEGGQTLSKGNLEEMGMNIESLLLKPKVEPFLKLKTKLLKCLNQKSKKEKSK